MTAAFSPPEFPGGDAFLVAHPETPGGPISAISVRWARRIDALMLSFRLAGRIEQLALPTSATPGRADRLWEHTCCEAFAASAGAQRYREFNFSPSGQWAVYDFDAYRTPAHSSPAHIFAIDAAHAGDHLTLAVMVPSPLLPADASTPIDLGLSCVVEDTSGRRYYWALSHPAGRPDFHCRAAFALHLPPVPQA